MLLIEADEPHDEVTFVERQHGARSSPFRSCARTTSPAATITQARCRSSSCGSYVRQDKKFGRIATPKFEIVGWSTLEDLKGKKIDDKKVKRAGGAR